MVHLWVKLDAEHVVAVADGGHRGVLGVSHAGKTRGQGFDPVAVTHPNLERRWKLVEENGAGLGVVLVQDRVAKLLFGPRGYLAAKLMHQGLHAVADAQDRQMALEDPIRYPGSPFFIHAGGTAGEDHTLGIEVFYRVPRAPGLGDYRVDF